MAVCSTNECGLETKAPVTRALHSAVVACVLFAGLSVANESEAATIRVPSDYATIQQAISAASNGDTVIVAPGSYSETIDFLGKDITVTSEQGPAVTIIDGHGAGSVVSFKSQETRNAVLSGFTLRGGYTNVFGGGGVAILSASPTIRGNNITDNRVCGSGGGISSLYGSPLIEHNTITRNGLRGCTGSGLGVYIYGNSAAEIVENLITENNDDGSGSVFGGGVTLFAAGSATVRGNIISNNVIVAPVGGCSAQGGAIAIANNLQGTIVDNVIVGNKACVAAAVYWIGYASSGGSAFVNNTVADNEGRFGAPAIYTAGVDGRSWIANNVITTRSGPGLLCNNVPNVSMPILASNDLFRADGPTSPYSGTCADQTGLNGNISADPLFVDPAHGDYRVQMTSPTIDAGDGTVPQLPPTDLSGIPRIVDGNGDGVASADIGAFEYHNHAPNVSAGDDRTVNLAGACFANVMLNASGSDPDGDALTFTWTSSVGSASGPSPSFSLPAGTYTFTVTANDGNGGFATDTVVVAVLDTTPPRIDALTAAPSVISAANHTMVPVVVRVAASDGCGAAVSCRIVAVTSNEPVDGLGDGDTSPDWVITGDLTVNLRAERSGNGNGRVYTITVVCSDPSGNQSTSTVTVSVPRNNP